VDGAVAIVLAAGRGERMDATLPKALLSFGSGTLVGRSVERASACGSVAGLVVVAPPGWEEPVRRLVGPLGVETVVPGGATRQASVLAGLEAVGQEVPAVVCHDAARPLASTELFARALSALDGWDGVVPVLPVTETVKRLHDDLVEGTEAREPLGLAQTPQAFVAGALREAHERATREGFEATDDAALLERAGFRVRAIPGERTNLKITTSDDVRLAEAIEGGSGMARTGLGFDVHPFARGRPLMLGGIRFDAEEGLAGHSDGDAVCHALADALLGAAGLGDIGERFPDTDPAFEGIGGLELLGRVVDELRRVGLRPASADVTIIAERPHVAPVRGALRESVAAALRVPIERVSVKGTRPEGLGLSGDGIGCIALAVLA
jgi:2-C-methyl-D-erythritol 4-phosphate cytidylyltransferase / 2-C-methyl-D-erythritol 2,4-cyclodiphosphate synthase